MAHAHRPKLQLKERLQRRDAMIVPGAPNALTARVIEDIGFDCRLLGPEEEAWLAGEGVLSAIPHADGIVADLGGGSLELVEVADGLSGRGISLPLGVLRLDPAGSSDKAAGSLLRKALKKSGLAAKGGVGA